MISVFYLVDNKLVYLSILYVGGVIKKFVDWYFENNTVYARFMNSIGNKEKQIFYTLL